MAYSDQTAVQVAVGGSERLKALTDQENTGSVNLAVLTAAITSADGWIDSYVQRRHAVPLSPVPPRIAEISAREAAYLLMLGRGMVPEWNRLQHEDDTRWLENLARGLVSPGPEPSPPQSSAIVPEVLERSAAEPVSRQALKGVW